MTSSWKILVTRDPPLILIRDCATRKNHWWIASLMTKLLFTINHIYSIYVSAKQYEHRPNGRSLKHHTCEYMPSTYLTYHQPNFMIHPRAVHTVNTIYFPGHHDDVIKWKHFPRYWPFVRGIHRSPVNSPHKGQWRGTLIFSLICVWINGLSKQSWGCRFETLS